MMRHLREAFAFDIHVRRDLDEKVSAKGIKVIARDHHQAGDHEVAPLDPPARSVREQAERVPHRASTDFFVLHESSI